MISPSAWRDTIENGSLLAVLHALRDPLRRDEAVYVGAHLPALLRGLYYEGWHPSGRAPAKSGAAFLKRVHDGVHRDPAVDPEQIARMVFALLAGLSSKMPRPPLQKSCTTSGQASSNALPMNASVESSSARLPMLSRLESTIQYHRPAVARASGSRDSRRVKVDPQYDQEHFAAAAAKNR